MKAALEAGTIGEVQNATFRLRPGDGQAALNPFVLIDSTGVILFVIATAAVFGWLLAYLQVPAAAVEFLQSFAHSKYMVLLMIIVMLLLLGTFMDLAPMILICTPIFLPVAPALGMDPRALMIPATLSASCAFMMPVATAPNAIMFGTGRFTTRTMASEGVVLNLLGAAVITTVLMLLL